MNWKNRSMGVCLAAMLLVGALACNIADTFIAQATVTPTRTPRPTFTPLPKATNTSIPSPTSPPPTLAPTRTPTRRPATPRPPTPKPPVAQPPAPTAAPVSQYEFHPNPPLPCVHSGLTFLKGTVYLDKNDPNSKYVGAIVALGPPDGSTIWDVVKTIDDGTYTFVLSDQGVGRKGTWAIWMVDPSLKRKSDISAPIVTNGLPDSDPTSCWTSGVDFWK